MATHLASLRQCSAISIPFPGKTHIYNSTGHASIIGTHDNAHPATVEMQSQTFVNSALPLDLSFFKYAVDRVTFSRSACLA